MDFVFGVGILALIHAQFTLLRFNRTCYFIIRMIVVNDKGLYCAAGDFYIDPWKPVKRAVITHAHSDHARQGNGSYLCVRESVGVIRYRIGEDISLQAVEYGETVSMNDVRVSLHPAGHILGSAQVRIESNSGEVWVVSGDYKTQPDPTCPPFEPLQCHTFITESTFGLPIYRWSPDEEIFAQINSWWAKNRDDNKASVLLGYSLGKAQRLLMGLDTSIGPIYTHGATEAINEIYRATGVKLPQTTRVATTQKGTKFGGAMILAPPSAQNSLWMRRFGSASVAFASGWMRVRGMRRRSALDRGFAMSDHADWPSLISTIKATGAENILVTHGYTDILVRFLKEYGFNASTMNTLFQGESEEPVEATVEESAVADSSENRDEGTAGDES